MGDFSYEWIDGMRVVTYDDELPSTPSQPV